MCEPLQPLVSQLSDMTVLGQVSRISQPILTSQWNSFQVFRLFILTFRIQSLVQSPSDLAIAQQFVMMLKNGTIGDQKFSKIVAVGHSYGAAQVQALSATLPDLIDGVILQGFSSKHMLTARVCGVV